MRLASLLCSRDAGDSILPAAAAVSAKVHRLISSYQASFDRRWRLMCLLGFPAKKYPPATCNYRDQLRLVKQSHSGVCAGTRTKAADGAGIALTHLKA